jgi:uncharacterized linocin/CFP29 family protein
MMDLLRRHQAPIAESSWEAIDEQAREVLTANLSARKLVDVSGPHGWQHSAVNLGRLDPGRKDAGGGVLYGIRKVLPLVEVRVPFVLDLWELDDVVRGAQDPNLEPLIEAATKLAAFEEAAIYHGFQPGGIAGMSEASTNPRPKLEAEPGRWPEAIATAMVALKTAGETPPYTLVAGGAVFQALDRDVGQYPLRRQIEQLIGSPIVLAPQIEGAFLLPADPEGDFELVLGQDISIGYEQQEGQQVRLYVTESFTFRVLESQAVVAFDVTSLLAPRR